MGIVLFIKGKDYYTEIVPYTGEPQQLHGFQNHLAEKQMKATITAIGDSLTKGVGDPDEQGYAGMTVKALKKSNAISELNFKDYGVKGDTTEDLLRVIQGEQVKQDLSTSDIIFITIGGNDLVQVIRKNFLEVDIEDFNQQRIIYSKNFNQILGQIRQLNPTATIYYIGLYNPFEDLLVGLNDQFKSIIDEWNNTTQTILNLYTNTVFIPTYDLFTGKLDQLLYTDHFHPNHKGYKLISERLLSEIQDK